MRFNKSKKGNIVTDGLVLYLDAGIKGSYPGSGTTWTDLSGSNDGTLTNGPTYSSANGGSIVFDGTDDYIPTTTLGSFGSELDTTGLTVEFVVKTTDTSKISQFLGTLNDINDMGFIVEFNRRSSDLAYVAGLTNFFLREDLNDIATHISDNIYDGNWHHLIGAWSPGANAYSIYVDGSPGTQTNGQTGSVTASTNFQHPIVIGANNKRGTIVNHASCSVGFFRLYNRALSAAEIAQNFEATRNRFGI